MAACPGVEAAGDPGAAADPGDRAAGAGTTHVRHRADGGRGGHHPAVVRQRRHPDLGGRRYGGPHAGNAAVPCGLHPVSAGPSGRLDPGPEQDDRPARAEPVRHRFRRADRPGAGQQRGKTALAAREHQRLHLQRGV